MNLQTNIKRTQSERGFTIVELLIVIVVIGILAAITLVAFNGVTNRAKTAKAQGAAQNIIKKAEVFNSETGAYPALLSDLTGAAATTTYAVPAATVTLDTNAIAAAPAVEATVNFATCSTTPTSVRVSYWDYAAGSIKHLYTGGSSSSSTCTLTAS